MRWLFMADGVGGGAFSSGLEKRLIDSLNAVSCWHDDEAGEQRRITVCNWHGRGFVHGHGTQGEGGFVASVQTRFSTRMFAGSSTFTSAVQCWTVDSLIVHGFGFFAGITIS